MVCLPLSLGHSDPYLALPFYSHSGPLAVEYLSTVTRMARQSFVSEEKRRAKAERRFRRFFFVCLGH